MLEKLWEIQKRLVGELEAVAGNPKKPRVIPRLHRHLGDLILGKVVVELRETHALTEAAPRI